MLRVAVTTIVKDTIQRLEYVHGQRLSEFNRERLRSKLTQAVIDIFGPIDEEDKPTTTDGE